MEKFTDCFCSSHENIFRNAMDIQSWKHQGIFFLGWEYMWYLVAYFWWNMIKLSKNKVFLKEVFWMSDIIFSCH